MKSDAKLLSIQVNAARKEAAITDRLNSNLCRVLADAIEEEGLTSEAALWRKVADWLDLRAMERPDLVYSAWGGPKFISIGCSSRNSNTTMAQKCETIYRVEKTTGHVYIGRSSESFWWNLDRAH